MAHITKFVLNDDEIPTAWVNVLPALKQPLDPPLDPRTRQPIAPEALAAIFPVALLEQEFSPKPLIDIPGEVLDIYRLWRPTHLVNRLDRRDELFSRHIFPGALQSFNQDHRIHKSFKAAQVSFVQAFVDVSQLSLDHNP